MFRKMATALNHIVRQCNLVRGGNQRRTGSGQNPERELGVEIVIDYRPPSVAGVAEQTDSGTGHQGSAERHCGRSVDAVGHMTAIKHIRDLGIPVVLFDSPSPDPNIPSIGNNYSQQGTIAAERSSRA